MASYVVPTRTSPVIIPDHAASHIPGLASSGTEPRWFAVYTMPQSENSVMRHLDARGVEAFLPAYESVRIWKNRQRMKITSPLFPSYVFVYIDPLSRRKVLSTPGAVRIVGNSSGPSCIPDQEIAFLRSEANDRKVEPYRDLVIGAKVRIRLGAMQGLEGTLVRRKDSLRFVLTVAMIHQNAAVEVDADELEPIVN